MLTFRRVFSRCIFSMREPRAPLAGAALIPSRVYQQAYKYPAGSEPAGLYIINKGGVCGIIPPRGRCITARNKYEKEILRQQEKFFLCFLCVLLCVAVRCDSCCLCNGAVVSYGGKVIVPLPYIYNMTNPSKNKNHFF